MSFFDKLTGKGDKNNSKDNKKPGIKNPFANVGKAIQGGNRTFQGQGNSLGGMKPGKLIHIELSEPGPLGMKIEKRPNSAGTAIIALVIEGSQAAAAGLQRGDIVCFAGTNGEEEIMYNLFIDMAASPERPLVFDIRRIETKTEPVGTTASRSAESYNRKQAVIAAAEAREKAAKAREKPIKKTFSPKESTITDVNEGKISNTPQSEEARRAVEAAKKGENQLAAQLGYNPYETKKATGGQARNATVATKHGAMSAGADGTASIPNVAPPRDSTTFAATDDVDNNNYVPPVSNDFAIAFEETVTSSEVQVVVSSFTIMRKLLINATTKQEDKFKRVRLSNPKIRAAISDVHGALDIMMACGFLLTEGDDGESYLVYSDPDQPAWLPRALQQLQQYCDQSA